MSNISLYFSAIPTWDGIIAASYLHLDAEMFLSYLILQSNEWMLKPIFMW